MRFLQKGSRCGHGPSANLPPGWGLCPEDGTRPEPSPPLLLRHGPPLKNKEKKEKTVSQD